MFTFLIDRFWPIVCRIVGVNGDLTGLPQQSLGAAMILDLIAGLNGAGQPGVASDDGMKSELWQSIMEGLETAENPELTAEPEEQPEASETRQGVPKLITGAPGVIPPPQIPCQWAPLELSVEPESSEEMASEDEESAIEAAPPPRPAQEKEAGDDTRQTLIPHPAGVPCAKAAKPAVEPLEPAHVATPTHSDRRAASRQTERHTNSWDEADNSSECERADRPDPEPRPVREPVEAVARLLHESPQSPTLETRSARPEIPTPTTQPPQETYRTQAAQLHPQIAAHTPHNRLPVQERRGIRWELPVAETAEQATPIMGIRLRASEEQVSELRSAEPAAPSTLIGGRRPAQTSALDSVGNEPSESHLDRDAVAVPPDAETGERSDIHRRTDRGVRETAHEEPRRATVPEGRTEGQRPVPTAVPEPAMAVRTGSSIVHLNPPEPMEIPAILSHEPVEEMNPASSPSGVNVIKLKLEVPQSDPVHVKFTERSGEVHVLVRSSQPGAASQLTADLQAFHENLATRGVEAETWLAAPDGIDANPSASAEVSEIGEAPLSRGAAESGYADSKGQPGGHQRGGRTWPDWLELLSERSDEAALRRFQKGMKTWRQ